MKISHYAAETVGAPPQHWILWSGSLPSYEDGRLTLNYQQHHANGSNQRTEFWSNIASWDQSSTLATKITLEGNLTKHSPWWSCLWSLTTTVLG
jgi:phage-related protein